MLRHIAKAAGSLAWLGILSCAAAQILPSPLICEDSLNGQPPFNSNNVPCLLGCGSQVAVATGSLLPGSVNLTEIPYCQMNCVVKGATPAESSLAPGCYQGCHEHNQATPENIGWCMYWCIGGLGPLITTTSCIPSLMFTPVATSMVAGLTVTIEGFTTPAAWLSWYQTQTVLSRTSIHAGATPITSSATRTSVATETGVTSTTSGGSAQSTSFVSQASLTQSGLSTSGSAETVTAAGQSASPTTTSKNGAVMWAGRNGLEVIIICGVTIIISLN